VFSDKLVESIEHIRPVVSTEHVSEDDILEDCFEHGLSQLHLHQGLGKVRGTTGAEGVAVAILLRYADLFIWDPVVVLVLFIFDVGDFMWHGRQLLQIFLQLVYGLSRLGPFY
jgi:hypothetical protein